MFQDPEPAFPVDYLLGKFRLKQRLGFGGMGEVWLAEDTTLGRKVALKVILPRYADNGDIRLRFLDEARAAAQVEHERIVRILEIGQHEGNLFIAMELLKGRDLQKHLDREPIPPLDFTLKVIAQVLQGLSVAHTHEYRLIHRDIKPQNIWLEDTQPSNRIRIKILDFGIAKSADATRQLRTQTGAAIGTLPYMSYEQLRGKPVDARSDLHSLGVMLYQMLTGRMPFRAPNIFDLEEELRTVVPPAPSTLNPGVPKALANFSLRMIAYDPNQRPATAMGAIAILNDLVKKPKPATNPSKRGPIARPEAPPASTTESEPLLLEPIGPAAPSLPEIVNWDDPPPLPRGPKRPVNLDQFAPQLPTPTPRLPPRDTDSRYETRGNPRSEETRTEVTPLSSGSVLNWMMWGGSLVWFWMLVEILFRNDIVVLMCGRALVLFGVVRLIWLRRSGIDSIHEK